MITIRKTRNGQWELRTPKSQRTLRYYSTRAEAETAAAARKSAYAAGESARRRLGRV